MPLRKLCRRIAVALCVFSLMLSEARARGEEASWVLLQVPGALGTYPMSINNSMAVTGYYYSSPTEARGFVRDAAGTITTFNVRDSIWTEPEAISDEGEITGYYLTEVHMLPQAFLRYPDGDILTFAPPCENYYVCESSQPVSINLFGEVAGSFPDLNAGAPGGFTRTRDGSFSISHFGLGAAYGGVITSINRGGDITGFYTLSGAETDSLSAPGYVPAPGSTSSYVQLGGIEATVGEGINTAGAVAGWFVGCLNPCANGPTTGAFFDSSDGTLTLFNPPGTLVITPRPGFTGPQGEPAYLGQDAASIAAPHRLSINEAGAICGSYTDASGAQHGFVRNPYGTITSFDPPKGHQTTATSINDAGVITGTYLYDGSNPTSVGFLRIPEPQP